MANNLGIIDVENNNTFLLANDLGKIKGTNIAAGTISYLTDVTSNDKIDFYRFELDKPAPLNSYIELSSPDVVAIQAFYQMRLYSYDAANDSYTEIQVSAQLNNYPYSYRLELTSLKVGTYVFGVAGAERDFANATGLYNLRISIPSPSQPGKVITGTDNNDTLVGGNEENTLYGNAGNDTLKGNGGDDAIYGGAGNDVLYGGDNSDLLNGGSGLDKVVDSGDLWEFILSNDRLIANGVDVLVGIEQAQLTGGNGENLLDASKFTLGSVVLDGGLDDDTLLGGSKNDRLIGGEGFDYLDGGTGQDILNGGNGGDVYVVDNLGDKIIEGTGYDQVNSYVSFTLGSLLENLTLLGTATINGTGNAQNNILVGNDANNILTGYAGSDVLNGGKGVDTLNGGTGDDTYLVDRTFDVIIETSLSDHELVKSSASKYTLSANLENLTLIDNGIQGTGNSLANTITGNGLNNIINGAGGDDIIYGFSGDDTLYGGSGNDFIYGDSDGNAGNDIIYGGSGNDEIYGGLNGKDILNGGAGQDFFASQFDNNDIYVFQFGESLLANPDQIDIFGVNGDKIDLLSKTGAAIGQPGHFTRAKDIDAFGLDKADVDNIFIDANGKLAGNQALEINSAAIVQTFGGISYLVVNDDTAGFQANTDLVISLGINTALPPLGAISADTFFL